MCFTTTIYSFYFILFYFILFYFRQWTYVISDTQYAVFLYNMIKLRTVLIKDECLRHLRRSSSKSSDQYYQRRRCSIPRKDDLH